MHRTAWTTAIAGCVLLVLGDRARAQQSAPDSARSTLGGVYTADQAARGRDVYAGMCTGCHTPASHTGQAFTNVWAGRTLWDLFSYVSQSMPQTDPGSLTPQEYIQLVAYLLEMNGLRAGNDELPADSTALRKIRFEVPPPRSRPGRPPQ